MKATITIQCDNAAFDDSVSAELARILRDVADKVVMADMNEPFDKTLMIRDTNGLTVGALRVTGKRS